MCSSIVLRFTVSYRDISDLFWTNPQLRLKLKESDDDNEDGLCTVIISLMQKTNDYHLFIGFHVYQVNHLVISPFLYDYQHYEIADDCDSPATLKAGFTLRTQIYGVYADHFAHLGRVFSTTNADLRRRDRAGAEYKHSYNTPSFTRGCWIVIG